MITNKLVIGTVASIASLAGVAQAEDLLIIDLTVANQITISATTGASSANASGSVFTGVYLQNFFGNTTSAGLVSTLVSGNLTAASNVSDNSPALFNAVGNSGLNIWSYSASANSTFTTGQQAFTGAGTWTMAANFYADMLNGPTSGNIYFAADTDDDLGGATVIGQYRVIPSPAALSMLGIGGLLGATRRRR